MPFLLFNAKGLVHERGACVICNIESDTLNLELISHAKFRLLMILSI